MESKTIVIAKCVGCGNKTEIIGGQIPKGEQPICQKCFMPMIAEKAVVRRSSKVTVSLAEEG